MAEAAYRILVLMRISLPRPTRAIAQVHAVVSKPYAAKLKVQSRTQTGSMWETAEVHIQVSHNMVLSARVGEVLNARW